MGTLHTLTRTVPDLTDLYDADMRHECACDMYDLATMNLDAARQAVTDAAKALALADETWAKAGADMDAAARALAAACKAAGVTLTAAGYVLAVPR